MRRSSKSCFLRSVGGFSPTTLTDSRSSRSRTPDPCSQFRDGCAHLWGAAARILMLHASRSSTHSLDYSNSPMFQSGVRECAGGVVGTVSSAAGGHFSVLSRRGSCFARSGSLPPSCLSLRRPKWRQSAAQVYEGSSRLQHRRHTPVLLT